MQKDPVDLVGLLIAALALVSSKEIAELVGPYMAIFILACAGAAFSASGGDKMSAIETLKYMAVRVLIALAVTVSMAELLQKVWPAITPRVSLIPLAFCIGAIRDFASLRDWVVDKLKTLVNRKIDDGK